jgi:hypothetical protein
MSEPHERIWAKNGHDSWGQYGHWYADSKGGGVEYVLADRIEELEAKLAKVQARLEKIAEADTQSWALRALADIKGESDE